MAKDVQNLHFYSTLGKAWPGIRKLWPAESRVVFIPPLRKEKCFNVGQWHCSYSRESLIQHETVSLRIHKDFLMFRDFPRIREIPENYHRPIRPWISFCDKRIRSSNSSLCKGSKRSNSGNITFPTKLKIGRLVIETVSPRNFFLSMVSRCCSVK